MATRVVHHKRDPYDVYVGRPSIFGNPFSHKEGTVAKFKVASADEALARYAVWLLGRPSLVAMVRRDLRGKVLGCWCRPKDGFRGELLCHAQILAGVADDIDPREVE